MHSVYKIEISLLLILDNILRSKSQNYSTLRMAGAMAYTTGCTIRWAGGGRRGGNGPPGGGGRSTPAPSTQKLTEPEAGALPLEDGRRVLPAVDLFFLCSPGRKAKQKCHKPSNDNNVYEIIYNLFDFQKATFCIP